ncbi:MAG TPA: 16S rRNA (cytosine(1402)-N(4))-methyltransferase RsmH [Planctomycetota bacterium]|nr:16S rRNA (cytosine(1402)-N(4))-methyltransferase RsmH [Planctomycetota bacterium]
MSRSRRADAGDGSHSVHQPVLPVEVTAALVGPQPCELEGWIVDGTVGAGGHAALALDAAPYARLIGVDQDPRILDHAREHLARFGARVRLRHARSSRLAQVLDEEGIGRVTGMLFDLGVSSLQLDTPERGFSFAADAPLDMRMDLDRPRTAADIVNGWDESDLADLFFHEGGETRSRRVAAAIVEARRRAPFLRTLALADLVERTLGRGKTHPATRVFQALRRAVNEEGEELAAALGLARAWLIDGGRLCVISFHSGEDAVVKRFLTEGAARGEWRIEGRKPIQAGRAEVARNRRARSAVLRTAVRTRAPFAGGAA